MRGFIIVAGIVAILIIAYQWAVDINPKVACLFGGHVPDHTTGYYEFVAKGAHCVHCHKLLRPL